MVFASGLARRWEAVFAVVGVALFFLIGHFEKNNFKL